MLDHITFNQVLLKNSLRDGLELAPVQQVASNTQAEREWSVDLTTVTSALFRFKTGTRVDMFTFCDLLISLFISYSKLST